MNPKRTVRLLAGARLVSVGGSQAAQLALAYTVYKKTGSAAWVSAALVASAGVVGLFGPLSGWIGDRYDRQRVMVVAELAGAVGWLAVLFAVRPVAVVALVLVATAVNAPFRAASSAAIPNLVDAEDLAWANGMLATAFNASLVLGPLIGGALVAAVGPKWVFGLNAVTFAVSAVLIAVLPGRFSADVEPEAPGGRTSGNIRQGFTLVARTPVLRRLVATTTFTFAAFGVTLIADLPLTKHFGAGSVGYGLLTTLWGLGAVLGSWLAGTALKPEREPWALVLGTIAMGLTIGSIAVMPNFPMAVLVGTVGGFGSGFALTPWFGMVQRNTDDRVRSRVFAAAETCEQGAFILGMVAGGAVAVALGPQPAYLVPGALLLLGAIPAARLMTTDRSPTGSPARRPARRGGRPRPDAPTAGPSQPADRASTRSR